jgi:hypothetical protein
VKTCYQYQIHELWKATIGIKNSTEHHLSEIMIVPEGKHLIFQLLDHAYNTSHCIYFVDPRVLPNLTCRDHLAPFRTSNKLSRLVWNEYNSWIPCASMLHDCQDSEILAVGTRQVKHWRGNRWLHTLTDSADEQAGMEKA